MTLYALSIRRPVLATVFSLVIILFGILGYTRLGVREYPAVDPPIISVSTSYRGANADVIDAQITEPLEEQINGIDGIRTLTSQSSDGSSNITVEFDLGTDLERAANDVRDRVSRAVGNLPPDADPPRVAKADADGDPIVFLNIASDERSLLELSDIAENLFKERLQTISGVARVDIWGEKRYAMRLWLDPARLAAYQLTPLDVQQALTAQNVELPSGQIEGESVALTVRTMGRLRTAEEFEGLIVKRTGDQLVRLGDVGRAELGAENERTVLKRDGTPMVGVVLRPLPGANYISIVDEFYERLGPIEQDMPSDLRLGIGFDQTTQIRESISEVQQTIFLALGLVLLVIFLFLRDWRTTIVPIVVIPIALIGAFAVMWLFGFSINILTLLALVLAIGLVVDDAIVVLENIYAKVEEGNDPIPAGIIGTKEIFFAVIATTLALVSVLLPIVFLDGLVGRLFREFGLVLMGAVVISSFVALTLTPMLATKLLKKRDVQPWFYRKTEPFFVRMTEGYRRTLEAFVARRWAAPVAMVASIVLVVVIFRTLPEELAPLEDRSGLRMFATAPEGATFDYMDAFVNRMIGVMEEEVPETAALITVTSPGFGGRSTNSAFARLSLVSPSERERSQQAIADALGTAVGGLTGARTFVSQEPTISVGRGGGLPVQYVLQAPNFAALEATLPEFMSRAQQDDAFAFVDVNLKFTKPELRVDIDRARAEKVGVSVRDVAQTLQLALAESRLGLLRPQRPAVPGHLAGRARRPRRDDGPHEPLRPHGDGRAGPARRARVGARGERAAAALPLQPLRLGDGQCRARAGRDARRRPQRDGRRRRRRPAGVVLDDARGREPRLPRELGQRALRVPPRPADDLPRARRAVRELPRPVHDPADRAARARRRAAFPVVLRPVAQHLQPDRHRDARRARDEERDPHRRIRQPAPRGRPLHPRGLARRGGGPLPPDPDDDGLDDPRHAPDRARARGRRAEPDADGDRDYRRPHRRDGADALRDPGGLPVPHAEGAGARDRGRLRRRRRSGGRRAPADSDGSDGVRLPIRFLLSTLALLAGLHPAWAQVPPDSLGPFPPTEPFAVTAVPTDTLPLLTLAEVTALVLEQNPTVVIARLEREIAERDASLGNAGFLPNVGLTATQRRLGSFGGGGQIDRGGDYSFDLAAGASVTVFEGLARVARYRRLRTLADVRRWDAEATTEAVLADAYVTYFDLARQQDQLLVLREAVALSEERLQIATGRRDVGAASELEVRRALVDLNADRAVLLRQQNALARSKAILNQLLDRTGGDFRVTDSVAVDASLRLAALEADALTAPDLRAALAGETAAEYERTAIRREIWPRVDLTAGYVFDQLTDPIGLTPGQAGGFTYGLTATFDLFDGFERRRRLGNAALRQQQQALVVDQTRTELLTALESTFAVYERSLLLVELEEENAEAARQNVNVALERFRLGVSTSLELREVQRALTDAQSRLVAAVFEAKQAEVELLTLSGRLLPE